MAEEVLLATIRAELNQFRQQMNEFARMVQESGRRAEQSFARTNNTAQSLTSTIRGLALAVGTVGIGRFIQETVQASNQMRSFELSLKVATGSLQAAREEMAFARSEANRLGVGLGESVQNFTRLTNATRGTRLEGQATREIFTALTEATRVLGLSNEQYGRVLLAVSQISTKGRIQQEELLQLAEAGVPVYAALGRALNKTGSELQGMLQKGQVGIEALLPLTKQLQQELGSGVADASRTFQAETSRMGNAIRDLLVEIGDLITRNPEMVRAMQEATKAVGDIARSIAAANGPLEKLVGLFARLASISIRSAADEAQELSKRLQETDKAGKSWAERLDEIAGALLQFIPFGEIFDPRKVGETTRELENMKLRAEDLGNALVDVQESWQSTEVAIASASEAEAKIAELRRKHGMSADDQAKAILKQIDDEVKAHKKAQEEREKIHALYLDDLNEVNEAWAALGDDIKEGQESALKYVKGLYKDFRTDAQKSFDEGLRNFDQVNERELESFRRQQQDLIDANKEAADIRKRDQEKALADTERAWRHTFERIEDIVADVLLNGFDNILDGFKRMLAQMAAAAITQRIIVPIVMQVFGSGAFGSGAAGPGGSAVNAGLSIFDLASQGVGGAAGSAGAFGGIANTPLVTFGSGQGPVVFGRPQYMYSAGTTITAGQAIGTIGAGYAGYQFGQQFAGIGGIGSKTKGGGTGQIIGAAVVGAAGTALFGPVGGAIGAMIGTIVGGAIGDAFGAKPPSFNITSASIGSTILPTGLLDFTAAITGKAKAFPGPTADATKGIGNVVLSLLDPLEQGLNALSEKTRNELKPEIDKQLMFLSDFIDDFKATAKSEEDLVSIFKQFLGQELPAKFQELFANIGAEIDFKLAQNAIVDQAVASIEDQVNALTEAIMTPAELFEKRLDEIASLQAQLFGAGREEALRLAPEIQQLVGQAFQLSGSAGVLEQDPLRLKRTQDNLIDVLRDLQNTLSGLPSFQGIAHPITFTRPTLAMVHQGETLHPAGRGGNTFNITVNTSGNASGMQIGREIRRELERQSLYGQSTIQTRRRR